MATVTMRLMLTAVTAVALCAGTQPSRAYGNGPWCAVANMGGGNVVWDCHYRSVEECRSNVIAGNRGFCNMNPAWNGPPVRARRPRKAY